jgi:DNA topoisomerase-1
MLITDLLAESFSDILQVGYTARMEEQLDKIEEGKLDWIQALKAFNKKFRVDLAKAEKEMRNVKQEEIPTDEVCEKCGNQMVIRWGRFGRFLACKGYPECKNTRELNGDNGEAPEPETTEERCPKCDGAMVVKKGRFGRFLACSNYPDCKTTRRIQVSEDGKVKAEAEEILDETCPDCGEKLAKRNGRFGAFVACSNYPKCKFIRRNTTGVPCPGEGCEGEIIERRSRKGRIFYGCSKYPDCKFVLWARPVAETCPDCGSKYLLEKKYKAGPKRICPNEECKYSKKVDKK